MFHCNPETSGSQIPCGGHIISFFDRHGFRPCNSRHLCPGKKTEYRDQSKQARTQDRIQYNHQKHTRKCQENIGEAHQEHIHFSTKISRSNTNCRSEDYSHDHRTKTNRKRNTSSVKCSGKIVSSVFICPENMLCRDSLQFFSNIDLIRIIWTKRCQNGSYDNDQENDDTHQCNLIGKKLFFDIFPHTVII